MRLLFEPRACGTLWVTCARITTTNYTAVNTRRRRERVRERERRERTQTTSHRARAHAPRDVNERHVCARRKLAPKPMQTAFTASRSDDPREHDLNAHSRTRTHTENLVRPIATPRARERRRTDGTRTDTAVGVAAAARFGLL